ncbi:MAG: hypothetical protein AAGC72_02575 [Planctomycetota bacterium]
MASSIQSAGEILTFDSEIREWHAFNNMMPPKPDVFYVIGEVLVGNPGVDVELCGAMDLNEEICTLELLLTQRAGNWPQEVIWKQVRHDRIYREGQVYYNKVVVMNDDKELFDLTPQPIC